MNQCVLKVDQFGILFSMVCGTISLQHFMFHDFPTIKKVYFLLFLGASVLTMISFFFNSLTTNAINVIRIFLLVILFIIGFGSIIHWIFIAKIVEIREISTYIFLAYFFLFLGFLLYFSKFPECVLKSKIIDIWLQSHTFWHICITTCAFCFYFALIKYHQIIYADSK